MPRLTATFGYFGAALTVAVMLVMPFLLFNLFTHAVAATGVRVDAVYGGGDSARVELRSGYRIVVNRPVLPTAPFSRAVPFVQLAWTPVGALPAHVSDEVDVDGDGRADVRADFDVPRDPTAPLHVDVTALGDKVRSLQRVSRQGRSVLQGISALAVRVNDRVVLRVPLTKEEAGRERAARAGR